ncbi:hypothetical protein I302_106357 [Kwoniella bestiolae CBS 10118]|uniref:Uncharacterized protein n=1 Tax=Kwoniella bestiolae CBS 10118 TaxID=1296100 RepID=A0AAJ8M933_9TREE
MNEPMDIDLSLDEIIAKKRSEERASRRSHPYERATTATQPRGKPSSNRSSSSPVKTTLTTLSFTDIKSKSLDPSFPSFTSPPLTPTPQNFQNPLQRGFRSIFPQGCNPQPN